jgi:2-dehydro-3-deoxygluconokinase
MSMTKKIVCFGEIMLRLSTFGFQRFVQTNGFDATYGGAEANVCVSLANYGFKTSFVTKVPNNEIGQAAINSIRRYGVDTKYIARGGGRLGIYFAEKGVSQRSSKIIYDRANSSIAAMNPDEIDWDEILEDAHWFHFTGITPALGGNLTECLNRAILSAKKYDVKISCDLNYRKNLWTREEAKETMAQLVNGLDLCIANEEDAKDVFGIASESTDVTAGKLNYSGYLDVAQKLGKRFDIKQVGITLRESISASLNNWSGMLFANGQGYFSKKYQLQIVDRIGGGDSFASGMIYSLLKGYEPQKVVEFAVAASCLKHSISGDFNLIRVNEAEKIMKGDSSGRVQR